MSNDDVDKFSDTRMYHAIALHMLLHAICFDVSIRVEWGYFVRLRLC